MGVAVDAEVAAVLKGKLDEPVRGILAFRPRIDFHRDALICAGGEDHFRVKLRFGARASRSLQEAADDLLRSVLELGRAFRTSGITVSPEIAHDVAGLSFLCELDELAAAGGDVRTRLFGA